MRLQVHICTVTSQVDYKYPWLFVRSRHCERSRGACCCSVGRSRPLLFVYCFCQGPPNNPAHVTLSARRVPAPKVHLCMHTKALQAHDRWRKMQANSLEQVTSSVEPNACWKDNSIM
ncbi:hypothetical protein NW756_014237 [Fusarium oxysporum]|nr:hypothetical protein NW753_014174 [Fusarium oxysporum]KAJ4032115.1 hypothetical protein NW763_014575 [Fusarium oxysporum]KAJ4073321.1 hypothetical protein NW756_014237 [Fusarium oxysporum]KAJ4121304.1 hypothetical protein NW769_001160 [Fusarium oxysporum]KAJ4233571.1 hypothetical protein NW760_005016 [Fusarium oxysporum]